MPTKTPNPKQIKEDSQKNPFIESDKGITQTTLANKLDSPITIHLTVEQSLARVLEAGPATRVNKDLDKELPKFKRMSEVDLVPIKSGYSSVKDPKQLQHNSLLLISQKVKLASPAPRRNRQFKKGVTTSAGEANKLFKHNFSSSEQINLPGSN